MIVIEFELVIEFEFELVLEVELELELEVLQPSSRAGSLPEADAAGKSSVR